MKITVDNGKYLVYSALTMTNTNTTQAKLDALKEVVNSYVRLVYRFPDGAEVEAFGYVYDNLTLRGEWIDIDILAQIERRDKGIEIVFSEKE